MVVVVNQEVPVPMLIFSDKGTLNVILSVWKYHKFMTLPDDKFTVLTSCPSWGQIYRGYQIKKRDWFL